MIDILFLGTGCMQPTKTRNHSGILLTSSKENILFDCGEGTQRQMRLAGVKPAKITRLCISHWHGDHVFGIPGLLSSMGADKSDATIHIYGPPGTKKYLGHLLQGFAAKDIIKHTIQEVKSGTFFENDEFMLQAQTLKHSVLKLSGPIVGKLQNGEDITLNGKKIKADDVSYIIKGKKISYIADTVVCEGAHKLAENADLLISEGTHLDDIKEKTEKYMHLTVKEAALIASENNAKKLIITHISQRYKSIAEIVEEARAYFDEAIVAEDFMRIQV